MPVPRFCGRGFGYSEKQRDVGLEKILHRTLRGGAGRRPLRARGAGLPGAVRELRSLHRDGRRHRSGHHGKKRRRGALSRLHHQDHDPGPGAGKGPGRTGHPAHRELRRGAPAGIRLLPHRPAGGGGGAPGGRALRHPDGERQRRRERAGRVHRRHHPGRRGRDERQGRRTGAFGHPLYEPPRPARRRALHHRPGHGDHHPVGPFGAGL